MEQETCSHSEKGGQAMPQEAAFQKNQGDAASGEQKGFQQNAESGQQGQMNMGHPGGYQPPHPSMQQSSHKCSGSSHSGQQMNMGPSGGYPNQPPYADMQQGFQQGAGQPQMNMGPSGGYYPNQSSHSGMKGGHSKPSHHCSGSSQQQYGPGHVSEMMGRFMTGGVTADDMNAVSGFFGIDYQNTRFWTGIALGAVGALILTKAFKS